MAFSFVIELFYIFALCYGTNTIYLTNAPYRGGFFVMMNRFKYWRLLRLYNKLYVFFLKNGNDSITAKSESQIAFTTITGINAEIFLHPNPDCASRSLSDYPLHELLVRILGLKI